MKQSKDWALITGASMGLGRAFATQCAANGINCVLVALETDLLAQVAAEITAEYAIQCRVLAIDLTRDDAVVQLDSLTRNLSIGLLINNAGFGVGGEFATRDPAKLEAMVRLNCLVPILLTRHYLPPMIERNRGGIILVASIMAFITAPYESAYNASKAFNLHFGESLRGELPGSGVEVLTLCPAGMRTGFFAAEGIRQKDIDLLFRLSDSPDRIAALAMRKLGKRAVAAPWFSWVASYLVRLAPRTLVTRIVRFIMQRHVHYD